ncbi:hypothetical protein D8B29_19835 [Verminephrobacter eiseniae]|nr:hypothetical protein [Verminephrobacter eiseniae]
MLPVSHQPAARSPQPAARSPQPAARSPQPAVYSHCPPTADQLSIRWPGRNRSWSANGTLFGAHSAFSATSAQATPPHRAIAPPPALRPGWVRAHSRQTPLTPFTPLPGLRRQPVARAALPPSWHGPLKGLGACRRPASTRSQAPVNRPDFSHQSPAHGATGPSGHAPTPRSSIPSSPAPSHEPCAHARINHSTIPPRAP